MRIHILYEDNDIIVIHKPAGIATQTGQIGRQDAVSELKNHLAAAGKGERKGAPFLGVIHRLDQPVEGLLVFGRTPQATASLNKQLSGTALHKQYYAVVYGSPAEDSGRLVDYLNKDNKANASQVVKEEELDKYPDAKKAVLAYRVAGRRKDLALLDIHIQTGRHHQIRVQMSHAGMPLVGDSKYGNEQSLTAGREWQAGNVALCAYYLKFIHPISRKLLEYTVSPIHPIFEIFKNDL